MKKPRTNLEDRLLALLADRYHGDCLEKSVPRILATGPEDEFESICLRQAKEGMKRRSLDDVRADFWENLDDSGHQVRG